MAEKKEDWTSLVPQYTFSETLEKQERQLAENPLLKRMNDVRKSQEGDPHRPIYHYVNPEGTLNDPNGLCFWQGNWHLFYQGYPPEDTRQHWGHAISKDLLHWRDLPYAIYPNPEYQCFSGASLVEENRVIAMYHGTRLGNMVATSSDPLLLNWEKVSGTAVIPIAGDDGSPLPYRVFDPCIWKKDGVYYALSAGTKPEGPNGKPVRADFLFRSADLAHWEYLHPFVEDDRFTIVGDDGACPYYWPIGNKHMLLFFSHTSGGQYLIGDYDTQRDKLIATGHGKFNHGAVKPGGVHAPSATPDGKGGLVVLFNMNPGKPTEGWNQIMSLPRRLSLKANGELSMEPAGDIKSLRREHVSIREKAIPANKETILEGIQGTALELQFVIDTGSSKMIEIDVLRSPGKEEYTRIVIYREQGYIYRFLEKRVGESVLVLDNAYSTTLPDVELRPPETASFRLDPKDPLTLTVFVDRSIVEVFANGLQCVAARVYPGRADSSGISILSRGGEAAIKSLDAWQMENIYIS